MVNMAWTESSLYEFAMNLSFCKSLEMFLIFDQAFFFIDQDGSDHSRVTSSNIHRFRKNYPHNIEVSCSFRVQPSFSYAGRNSRDANIQLSSIKLWYQEDIEMLSYLKSGQICIFVLRAARLSFRRWRRISRSGIMFSQVHLSKSLILVLKNHLIRLTSTKWLYRE